MIINRGPQLITDLRPAASVLSSKEVLDRLFATMPKGKKNLRMMTMKIRNREVLVVEQNPNKGSEYAARARQGERIAWAFHEDKYWARIAETEGIVYLRG